MKPLTSAILLAAALLIIGRQPEAGSSPAGAANTESSSGNPFDNFLHAGPIQRSFSKVEFYGDHERLWGYNFRRSRNYSIFDSSTRVNCLFALAPR